MLPYLCSEIKNNPLIFCIMTQDYVTFGTLEDLAEVIKEDLTAEYSIESTSAAMMNILGNKVSLELLDLLNSMLLGFCNEMQLEMADDLLDFAQTHVVNATGCLSADAALMACYQWIAEEQGIEWRGVDIINKVV